MLRLGKSNWQFGRAKNCPLLPKGVKIMFLNYQTLELLHTFIMQTVGGRGNAQQPFQIFNLGLKVKAMAFIIRKCFLTQVSTIVYKVVHLKWANTFVQDLFYPEQMLYTTIIQVGMAEVVDITPWWCLTVLLIILCLHLMSLSH